MKYLLLILSAVGLSCLADLIIVAPVWVRTPGSPPSSTLNDSLVSYWKMDESSGTRVDSETTGTAQDLTSVNSTGATNGILGNAGLFIASSVQSLTHSDSSDLSTGDIDFTITGWFQLKSLISSSERHIVNKYYGSAGRREYAVLMNSSERLVLRLSATGNALAIELTDSTFGSFTTNTWYWFAAWHDSTNNVIGISINNSTAQTTAYTSGVFNSSQQFTIGNYEGGTAEAWDGFIDEVGFWKRVLTESERSALYNAGSGTTCCPF